MIRIAIIAGHCSTTAGKRTPPMLNNIDVDGDKIFDIVKGTQYKEHYANVGVSIEQEKAFTRCGFEIVRVGYNDSNATDDTLTCDSAGLVKRQQIVKASKCDASVSNHFNAFGYGDEFNAADGICTYYHSVPVKSGDSARLARLMITELVKGTKQRSRDIHSDAFAEVNCQAMGTKASVLNEYAFMTNQHEAETMMANSLYWKECAEETCKAFCKFFNVPYVEENPIMEIKTITAKMNGIPTSLKSLVIEGENYVRLRDLADAQKDDNLDVTWDGTQVCINSINAGKGN